MKGQWGLKDNVTNCINPNLCYDDPPSLPADFSVNWNQGPILRNSASASKKILAIVLTDMTSCEPIGTYKYNVIRL
jgi:hypothetical protein